jgi:putative ABC transport system permease protein
MLGVVIGVAAVVTMMAVGAGAQARVAAQIQSLGSNLIMVISGSITASGVRLGTGSQLTVTEDDARAMEREIDGVQVAAPTVRGGAQVVAGNANWATAVFGACDSLLPRQRGGVHVPKTAYRRKPRTPRNRGTEEPRNRGTEDVTLSGASPAGVSHEATAP